jgi:hypothetical protein
VATCPIIAGAKLDEVYVVTGQAEDASGDAWYRICCPGEKEGWVRGDLVALLDPRIEIPWVQVRVCPIAFADFDQCDRGAYFGLHGVDWPEGTVNRVTERYPGEPGRGCVAELAYEVVDWASFWIDLQHADLSRHTALVFDARVDEPLAESLWLKIELKRADGREIGFVWVERYKLLTTWAEIRIPFERFKSIDYPGLRPLPTPQEWTQMEELVLTVELVVPEGADRGLKEPILYLDDIHVQ